MKRTEKHLQKIALLRLFFCTSRCIEMNEKMIVEIAGELGRSESKACEEKALTFPCQLTVV